MNKRRDKPAPPPARRKILISKSEIAGIFEDMSHLLEIAGANPFKVRAFTNAARELEGLPGDLEEMVNTGELLDVQGIGKGIFAHIKEILETGTFADYEELRSSIPPGLLQMLRVPGVGPKKVKIIFDTLGVASIEELEQAAHDDRIADLPGFGEKSQEKILSGIDRFRRYRKRHLLSTAMKAAQDVYDQVSTHAGVKRSLLGGSLRRGRETVKDIDILVSSDSPEGVTDVLVSHPAVESVVAHGTTKTSVVLDSGINVDMRVVDDEKFPFAALYFTGNKEHNTDMRSRAKKMGYKLNEYGLFRGDDPTPCADEEAVFEKLGLAYIPPELRESMGEIQAAEAGALPALVEQSDIRGLIHMHTRYSDGHGTIQDMAEAARALGMSYIGITDHSRSVGVVKGLSIDDIAQQRDEIAGLQGKIKEVTILHGVESEILEDGSLDYPPEVLDGLDFVIASLHSELHDEEARNTERIIKAVRNPYTNIIAHPTGRRFMRTPGYKVNLNAIIEACAEYNVMIEINGQPERLDLDWRYVRSARDAGVRLVVTSDAHRPSHLGNFRYAVLMARKGWLTADDVLNTRTVDGVREILDAKRPGRP